MQGEGRGHLTQALAVYRSLSQRGHELVAVVVGDNGHRALPAFFTEALPAPVVRLASPGFSFRADRSIDLWATLARVLGSFPAYCRSIRALRRLSGETRPDVIINFFEPLTGLAQLVRPLPCPVVSIAHQFMFEHPDYQWPRGLGWRRLGLLLFVSLVGRRSWKLALSLAPAPDRPGRRLVVGPPLLRPELFAVDPHEGGYYLVYLLNHGYSEEIRTWQARHPDTVIHCFMDRPEAPSEEVVAPNLTFHRLDGAKFLRMMAGCRAVVSTAGFESVSEAAWLGKPVFLVPIEHHLEQYLNAIESSRLGFGIADRRFALDRLGELPPGLPTAAFRAWTGSAERCFDRVLAGALARRPTPATLDPAAGRQ